MDMLDDSLFVPNFDGLLIAQDLDTAKDIFTNKVELAWANIEEGIRKLFKINTENTRKYIFELDQGIRNSIAVDASGRAQTYSRVHITEFAQVCAKYPLKAKEILEGTIPAVPKTGRVDIESTAEGEGGAFHDLFWEAWERGDPHHPEQFKAHFYNWLWDPDVETTEIREVTPEFVEYANLHKLTSQQISFYFNKWESLGRSWEALKRNYPTTPEEAFTYSGNKLFDQEKLIEMKKQCENGELVQGWIVYEHPITGHHYVIGADVAEGLGQDSSTAVVIDFTARVPKVVATYANNKVDPGIFAYELQWAGNYFKSALIAVERNNHGHTTILRLRDIYSEDLIYQESSQKWGWQTNLVTKPKMMFDLAEAIANELIDIPSRAILAEMQTYDKSDLSAIRFDPEATKHWDMLVATAIAFQMKTETGPRIRKAVIHKPSPSTRTIGTVLKQKFPKAVIHKPR